MIKMFKKKSITEANTDYASIAFCFYLMMTPLLDFFDGFKFLGSLNQVLQICVHIFFTLLVARVFFTKTLVTKLEGLIASFWLISFLMSYLLCSDTEVYYTFLPTITRFCVPCFFIGISIKDEDYLDRGLYKIAWGVLIIMIFNLFVFKSIM